MARRLVHLFLRGHYSTKRQGKNTIPFWVLTEPTVIGIVTEALDLHCGWRTYIGRAEIKAGSTNPVEDPGTSVPWIYILESFFFILGKALIEVLAQRFQLTSKRLDMLV